MEKKILDLGCGKNKWKNAIGVDIVPFECVDIIKDLREPLPFDDSVFDIVILNNVLEHFKDITPILREVHRVTKSTGKVGIMVPYYNSPLGIQDPTHKTQFSEKTIYYYTDKSNWNYYIDFKFKLFSEKYIATRMGSLIPNSLRLKFARIFGNLVSFIIWILQPIKDENCE